MSIWYPGQVKKGFGNEKGCAIKTGRSRWPLRPVLIEAEIEKDKAQGHGFGEQCKQFLLKEQSWRTWFINYPSDIRKLLTQKSARKRIIAFSPDDVPFLCYGANTVVFGVPCRHCDFLCQVLAVCLYSMCVYSSLKTLLFIESQSISSRKGLIRIIKSNSLLLAGLPKIKPYD